MRDFGAIHRGFEALLRYDPWLITLAPGGVWHDLAPQRARGVFLIYRVQHTTQHFTHDRGGYDQVIYSVVAMEQSDSATGVKAAAARVLELLPDVQFEVTGYQIIRCELFHDGPDVTAVLADGDRRWQQQGSVWDVLAAPFA